MNFIPSADHTAPGTMDRVLAALDAGLPASLERLKALIAIPSISTDPAFAADCQRAADWLSRDLEAIGFAASVRQTPGHPMVVGHYGVEQGAPKGAAHILFYGHYDVQPVDPLELWNSDPFKSEIVDTPDGKIITGRGSADDKGQLMTFIEACRAWIAVNGALPISVTVLLEGEEESSSPSLKPFLEANAAELKADAAFVCDTNMWDAATPAISTGLRGLVQEEVTITAANRDLHSGYFGGAAANPIHILASILAAMHDDGGRVTLPGFYDGVLETPDDIKAMWAALGRSDAAFLGEVGLSVPSGEKGRSVHELTWARPTAEVNGISGGYSGTGFKTVIAARAHAKVSFRLVGAQDPDAVRDAFRAFVQARLPADCTAAFHAHGASPAIQLDYDSPMLKVARAVLGEEWGKPAVMIGMGGSIPIVGDFKSMLGMPSLLVGFGLADDRIHSPNEKYALKSFAKGQRSWARLIGAFATKAALTG
jgi:acetylornithine deacetylase/succinyl-diaminopimelate desuccinylase-like protein